MSDTNAFGYVEIKDGMVVCYTGDSRTPTIHKFENADFVSALKLRELVKERIRQAEKVSMEYEVEELQSLVDEAEKN